MLRMQSVSWRSGKALIAFLSILGTSYGAQANDDCANALAISTGLTPFDTTSATTDGQVLDALVCDMGPFGTEQIENDIWFCFTAPTTDIYLVTTFGLAGFDTRLAVYDNGCGPDIPALVVACNDDFDGNAPFEAGLTFSAVAGSSYKVRLGGFATTTFGTGQLSVEIFMPPVPPANDDCVNGQVIGVGTTAFDSTLATTDGLPLDPLVCDMGPFGDEQIHNDLWYVFTAPSNQQFEVTTVGLAGFDTRLAVYDSSTCPSDSTTVIACNDDFAAVAPFEAGLSFMAVIGGTYQIRLGGFNALTAGAGALRIAPATTVGPVQVPVPAGAGKLLPQNPILGDVFGTSLDVDGNLLVTGGEGSAWIYENVGGFWFESARLTAPNASLNFGLAVAIDGDRVIVGDTGDDEAPVRARVFVFERVGPDWVLTASLPDSNGKSAFDSFGSSIAIHGDSVIVGSKHVGGSIGAAFIYNFDGLQWNEVAGILAPTPRVGAVFGSAVAIFGDRAAIGAPGDPFDQVVVYENPMGVGWLPTRVFSEADTGPTTTPNSGFGTSVALGANTIIVGMPSNGFLSNSAGSIAVFSDIGTGFVFDEVCTASDVDANDQFGTNVSLDANHILVGSPFDGVFGSAYLFTIAAGTLVEDAKFTPADGQPGDRFGTSVAVSGTTVAFGAPFNQEAGSWVGAVYTLTQMISPTVISAFCFGDGGDQVGCVNCPCGNNAAAGALGGCLNSTGTSAQLSIMGQASLTEDSLRLEIARANPNTFSLLFSGSDMLPNNPANPCPPGAGVRSMLFDGLRCVGVALRRHGTRATDVNGNVGVSNAAWGLGDDPVGGLVQQGAFSAGQTRYFQASYREVGNLGCNTGLNTTNAAAAIVVP